MPSFLHLSSDQLDQDLVTEWYKDRAAQISQKTGLTQNALHLLEIGMESGVIGLREMWNTLLVLNYLIYDCECSCLNLVEFQSKDPLEIVKLMMSKVSCFMKN